LKLIPLQIDDGYKTLVEIKVLRKLFGKNGQAVSRKKILMLMEQVLIFSKLNLSQNDHERICSEVFPSLVQIFVTHMGNFRDERSLPQRVAAKISSYFSANDLTQREETDLIYHNLLAILATVSDEFKIQHQQSLEVLVNSFHAYNVDYREIAENRRDRSQYKNLDYMLALMSLAETQQSLENDHSLSEMESYQQQKTVQAFLEISILRAVLEVADMMERVGFLKEGQELPLELVGIKAMVKKYFAGAGENHTHAKLVHHILNYLSDPKSEKLPKNYAYIKDLSRELGMQHFLKSYLLRKNSAFELRLP